MSNDRAQMPNEVQNPNTKKILKFIIDPLIYVQKTTKEKM